MSQKTFLPALALIGGAALIIALVVVTLSRPSASNPLADSKTAGSSSNLTLSPANQSPASDSPEAAPLGQIEYQGVSVPLLWTDNNEAETLIIKSDRRHYDASAQTVVFFSVTNESQTDQNAAIYFWFDDDKKTVVQAERIESDVSALTLTINNDFPKPDFPHRKDVLGYTQGSQFQDIIPAGATNNYRVVIACADTSQQNEFFIEAIGAQGGYGHLDPYLASGLVGYWSFNGADMNGTTALDRSGQNNNGTLTGGVTKVPGISGQGLSLDGVNDYVSIPDNGTVLDFTNTSPYTWSAWLKYSSFPASQQCFISKDVPGKNTGFNLCLNQTGSTADVVICHYVAATWTCSAGLNLNLSPNIWTHVVIAYNGSSNWNTSINGVYQGVQSLSVFGDVQASYYIGAGTASSLTQTPKYFFNGLLDEIRLYNRALSVDEIKDLYHTGAARMKINTPAATPTGLSSGLVGYWSFNGPDMNGTTALDRSGQNNNGTLTGGVIKVPGISGQGLSFNGSTGYVDVPYNANLDNPNSFSLSAWAKSTISGSAYSVRGFIMDMGFFADRGYGILLDPATDQMAGYYGLNGGGSDLLVHCQSTLDKNWHLYSLTYDGVNLRMYSDGVIQGSPVSQAPQAIDNNPLMIGMESKISERYWNGLIDEVRIYNRALSASEVQELYQQGQRRVKIKAD